MSYFSVSPIEKCKQVTWIGPVFYAKVNGHQMTKNTWKQMKQE
jgi:hypothetical protein